jgi:hypothetical protein
MFDQSKPVYFERHAQRRSRWRLPRWLVLLLLGLAAGAGGLVFVQERYLPPRLSAVEGATLRSAFEQAEAERLRLQGELATANQRLDAALAQTKRQEVELAAPRAAAQRLRDDLGAVIVMLPPDPRGGNVEVRGGRFTVQGGALAYDVVLTRERNAGKPLAGVMQLSVAGASRRGAETSVTSVPLEVSIGSHEIVRGRLALPEGFQPRQATIQVLDRPGGKALGMRIMRVV